MPIGADDADRTSRYRCIMTPDPFLAAPLADPLAAPEPGRLRRAGAIMGAAGRSLFDLVLPPVCMACRQPVAVADALCARCWSRLTLIDKPYCARLGIPFSYDLGEGALSAEAIADPPPFDRARAAAVFDDVARDVVHGFKYRDHTEHVRLMARLMARAGQELLDDADVIVPVPLHRWRLWRRRFNQAALLGAEISRLTGVAFDPLILHRIRATQHQVGLTGSERDRNVRGAFRVTPDRRPAIADRRVLLIDDVLTSGATVKASTRALLRGGAQSVDVLVFARVVGKETGII
ncbi:ComF family protein [Rhodobium orientis]|nr:ComF family protein [Rhodobium orientis]MBB4305573.1 ComF family protein [Rhodobium orientis]